MKLLIVVAVFALVAGAYGATLDVYDDPVYDLDDEIDSNFETPATEPSYDDNPDDSRPLYRTRRFTCDILSFESKFFSTKHSACAIKCFAKRRKGGRCNEGRCICRSKWGRKLES